MIEQQQCYTLLMRNHPALPYWTHPPPPVGVQTTKLGLSVYIWLSAMPYGYRYYWI